MTYQGFIEPWLKKGQFTSFDCFQPISINFNTIHFMSVLRKPECSRQTDKSKSKNSNYHLYSPSPLSLMNCRNLRTPSRTKTAGSYPITLLALLISVQRLCGLLVRYSLSLDFAYITFPV